MLYQVPFEIRLNAKGEWLPGVFIFDPDSAALANAPSINGFYVASSESRLLSTINNASFQITRPAKRSAASPMELPVGTYIDLSASGFKRMGVLRSSDVGNTPITLTFNPDGSIAQMANDGAVVDVTDPIFLLIGNQKNDGADNLQQGAGSLWAVVHPSTGDVRTTENFVPDTVDNVIDDVEEIWSAALAGPTAGGR